MPLDYFEAVLLHTCVCSMIEKIFLLSTNGSFLCFVST